MSFRCSRIFFEEYFNLETSNTKFFNLKQQKLHPNYIFAAK